jgi:hypothetical protein
MLRAGEVPKFFDNVLAKRAGEAVSLKGMWWDARRDAAMEGIKEQEFKVGVGVGGGGAACNTAAAAAVTAMQRQAYAGSSAR